MNCYIISYELKDQSKDYTKFIEAIKAYGTWAHICESAWAILTEQTAVQVRENLRKYLSDSDTIFVIRSGKEAAWANVLCKNEWLKNNL